MKDLKSRFLATLGYVYAEGESPNMVFARLRAENPDAFPVPRRDESLLEACDEVVRAHEQGGAS